MYRVIAAREVRAVAARERASPDIANAIAIWCDALHENGGLADALAVLLRLVGAEAGLILRGQGPVARPQIIALHDRVGRTSMRPLRESFAAGLFGADFSRSRAGALWHASAMEDVDPQGADPALEDWHASRNLQDFVSLVLASGTLRQDHIELHFRFALSPAEKENLVNLAPILARTWATRRPGLVTRQALTHRQAPPAGLSRGSVLGLANPARLSRAEFRVCLLLSRGLSVTGVAEELDLSEATVRTHLRNIYAKTEATSLAQLVYLLMTPPAGAQPGMARPA